MNGFMTNSPGTPVSNATNANTYAQERDDGTSAVNKKAAYDRIVAAGDIVSVTVGDVEIPVSAA